MDINEALNYILSGNSLEDVIDSLLESGVTPAHGHIRRLKLAIRELREFYDPTTGFSQHHQSETPTTREQRAARILKGAFESVLEWLKVRVPHLKDPAKAKNTDLHFKNLKLLENQAMYANLKDEVFRVIIRVLEAGDSLKKSLNDS